MGFKQVAVITDVYEMSKGQSVNVNQKDSDPIFLDRIQDLVYILNKNSKYKLTRRFAEIKWHETAVAQLEAGNLEWLEYALDELTFFCQTLKSEIGFGIKDDYRTALSNENRRGGVALKKKNDYISVVEDWIDVLEDIEFKPLGEKVEEFVEDVEVKGDTIESLKAIIKAEGLSVRVNKGDSIEKVKERIEKARG